MKLIGTREEIFKKLLEDSKIIEADVEDIAAPEEIASEEE